MIFYINQTLLVYVKGFVLNSAWGASKFGHIIVSGASTSEATVLSGSATIILQNNQNFSLATYQNSGSALTIGGNFSSVTAGYGVRIQITRL
jgi:hypothetical protein